MTDHNPVNRHYDPTKYTLADIVRALVPPRVTIPTPEQIEAAKTSRGGFTRSTLESWGIPWPPPKGWREALETKGSG